MPNSPFNLARHNADFESQNWAHHPITCNCREGQLNKAKRTMQKANPTATDEDIPQNKQLGDGQKIL